MRTSFRMVIYIKDIQRITGRGSRYSRNLMGKIRLSLGKNKTDLVSVKEFCRYMNLSEEEVIQFLKH